MNVKLFNIFKILKKNYYKQTFLNASILLVKQAHLLEFCKNTLGPGKFNSGKRISVTHEHRCLHRDLESPPFLRVASSLWKQFPAYISTAQAWRAMTGMCPTKQRSMHGKRESVELHSLSETILFHFLKWTPFTVLFHTKFQNSSYPQLACMRSATFSQQMCFWLSSVHLSPATQGWCLAQGRWASPRGWEKRSHSIRRKTQPFPSVRLYPFPAIRLGWTCNVSWIQGTTALFLSHFTP